MKKKLILVYFIVLCSALSFQPLFSTTKPLSLNIQAVVELGRENLMFQNIESICEDLEENFYVLDSKAFKVYKFSPKGKLLLSFGSRGEGPGEFRMHAIFI